MYLTTALLKYRKVFVKCSNKLALDADWSNSLVEIGRDNSEFVIWVRGVSTSFILTLFSENLPWSEGEKFIGKLKLSYSSQKTYENPDYQRVKVLLHLNGQKWGNGKANEIVVRTPEYVFTGVGMEELV